MKKWAPLLFGVLISFHASAETDLSATIVKSMMQSDHSTQTKPIIYVGKDFSLPQIAIADLPFSPYGGSASQERWAV